LKPIFFKPGIVKPEQEIEISWAGITKAGGEIGNPEPESQNPMGKFQFLNRNRKTLSGNLNLLNGNRKTCRGI